MKQRSKRKRDERFTVETDRAELLEAAELLMQKRRREGLRVGVDRGQRAWREQEVSENEKAKKGREGKRKCEREKEGMRRPRREVRGREKEGREFLLPSCFFCFLLLFLLLLLRALASAAALLLLALSLFLSPLALSLLLLSVPAYVKCPRVCFSRIRPSDCTSRR